MPREPRIYIPLVDQPCSLSLGQNEIGQEGETEERVEREPGEQEEGPGLEEGEEGEDDEVHEPGRELGGVGGTEGFVRGEDGEWDGYEGAVVLISNSSEINGLA